MMGNNGSIITHYRPPQLGDVACQTKLRLLACKKITTLWFRQSDTDASAVTLTWY